MKSKLAAVLLAALSIGFGTALEAQETRQDEYRLATELYEHGMFEMAGSIFGDIYAGSGDVMAGGYEALCAVRLQERGNETLADEYVRTHPYSSLLPQIHFSARSMERGCRPGWSLNIPSRRHIPISRKACS